MVRHPAVTTTPLPQQSLLHARAAPTDFLDCYSVASDLPPRQAAGIITAFPGWVQVLMRLRGVLTAPFGLAKEGPKTRDSIGIFPVETETAEEIIAGFNDRHLNFRISVQSREGRVFLATWVHPHNPGGRLYLRMIMPFHILISRNALARVATQAAAT